MCNIPKAKIGFVVLWKYDGQRRTQTRSNRSLERLNYFYFAYQTVTDIPLTTMLFKKLLKPALTG